jgi:hypothetical protein
MFASSPCNATANTVCQAWSPCQPGTQFTARFGTPTSDRLCAPCIACTSGRYQTGGCDGTINTTCGTCTTCTTSQFESSPCTPTSPRSCASCHFSCAACSGPLSTNCTQCPSGALLQDGTCVSQCSPGLYLSGTTCLRCDTSCRTCNGAGLMLCSSCPSGRYLYTSGTSSICTTSCPTGTVRSGGVCASCSQCEIGSIITGGCIGTTLDTVCANCSVTLGQYQDQRGQRACKNATVCRAGQAEVTFVCVHL